MDIYQLISQLESLLKEAIVELEKAKKAQLKDAYVMTWPETLITVTYRKNEPVLEKTLHPRQFSKENAERLAKTLKNGGNIKPIAIDIQEFYRLNVVHLTELLKSVDPDNKMRKTPRI